MNIIRHTGGFAMAMALAPFALAPAHAVNLVANGSFDNLGSVWTNNTGLGGNDLQTAGGVTPPGWTAMPANVLWVTTPSNYDGTTASPGNASPYWVDLTGEANAKPYGGLRQTIATTPGTAYLLTFDLGASVVFNSSGLGAAALTASASGTSPLASRLFTSTPASLDVDQWTGESLAFTADSGSTLISFLADSDYSSRDVGLDNVGVTAVGPVTAPVPEPAVSAMLGLGLAGLWGGRFLKRRRAGTITAAR